MKILLIGGIGYVGGRLAAHLKSQGHYVRVTTRRPPSQIPGWLQVDDVIQADPLDSGTLRNLGAEIDVAMNLAAPDEILAAQHPEEALRAGSEGCWNVLQALSQATTAPAVIYLSTFHVYGAHARGLVEETVLPAPVHPYALGKYLGENVLQAFRRQKKIRGLCVRLSNAFGAPAAYDVPRWSLVFNDLCRQAVTEKKLTLKSAGTHRRNFIPMTDAVRALEFLAQQTTHWPADGVIHLGSDRHWSILEAAERVAKASQIVLGAAPPIVTPPDAAPDRGEAFIFSVDRLKTMGYVWTMPWEEEILATLKLCRDAHRQPHHA